MSLVDRIYLARDMARGLAWLHSAEPMIVHRDIVRINLFWKIYSSIISPPFLLIHLLLIYFIYSNFILLTDFAAALPAERNEFSCFQFYFVIYFYYLFFLNFIILF